MASIRVLVNLIILWASLHKVNKNIAACRLLAFNPPMTGKVLVGHVIKSAEVKGPGDCRALCYMEDDCQSVNTGPANQEGKFPCQINRADHTQHPGDLIDSQDFSYWRTENKCTGVNCPEHRKCQNGFTDAGFRCVCTEKGENFGQVFGWTKVNTDPICFGARDDKFGLITIKTAGQILSFKLVHVSGEVTCNIDAVNFESKWGCAGQTAPYKFDTHIAYLNRSRLFPEESLLSKVVLCNGYNYDLPGFTIDSNEIIFNNLTDPISVCPGDQFGIWYGQDLNDCSEHNNGGETCADVYGLYL